jgi:phenylacetate-coenzyme A ligase PaaK-like adenylate-forming protein
MGLPHVIGLIFSMLRASQATPEEIDRIREKRLRLLLRTAVAQSPFYRNLYRGVNNPAHRAGHLKKLEEGDCIPHPPAPHSSPSIGRGILREDFIN